MVYLIGCDHRKAQNYRNGSALTDPENHGQVELKKLILSVVTRHQVCLIAEESNADVLHRSQSQSVVYEAACEAGVEHRFCDPTPEERDELSIETELPFYGPCSPFEWEVRIPSVDITYRHEIAHRWPIREEFWIHSLGDDIHQNLLFICGDAHRWTFRRRLEAKGIKVELIAKRVGAERLDQDFFNAYREVRRNGFPPSAGCFCVSPIK